jgi:hypothetical protein
MLILFVGIFTIIAIAGAIAVDFSVWFSERRGAAKDADLIALAGAYELLADDGDCMADVQDAVEIWADENEIDPVDDVHNLGDSCKSLAFPDGFESEDGYCHDAPDTGGRPNMVVLDVDHESKALFASIFGVAAPEIGAHACARAGSLHNTRGLRPWTVAIEESPCFGDTDGDTVNDTPLFGADCIFRDEDDESSVGSIRLGRDEDGVCSPPGGGANAYQDNIVEGSPAECAIGDIVGSEPGLDNGPTFAALEDLLATEGDCDDANGDGDGIDQFDESFATTDGGPVVPGPDQTFVPLNDCKTPRAIHIINIRRLGGPGFEDYEIEGFAAFFLEQCEVVDPGDPNDPDDDVITAVYEDCNVPPGDRPNAQIRGFFMSILELEGDIGDFDEFGTKVIRLVE